MNINSYNNQKFNNGNNGSKKFIAALLLLLIGISAGYLVFKNGKETTLNVPPLNNTGSAKATVQVPSTPEAENISPYTGMKLSNSVMNNIPFMVVIENSNAARPQSGLSQADIVFETMAEGGIPRFIALFHSGSPKVIGPIRSARPYFLMLAEEYNLPFGHCGGSPEAMKSIKDENLMSMNEFAFGAYYWRDNTRKMPHNLYTSAEKLRNLITDQQYIRRPSSSLKFDIKFWKNNFDKAEKIDMQLNRYYSTSYVYKDGLYYKSMDNEKAIDKSGNNQIAVNNIVIQFTDIQPITNDDKGRISIKQIGEGTGYLISNGKYIKIKWSKKDDKSPTLLRDEQGKDIYLSPGKTWWHIIDNKSKLDIS